MLKKASRVLCALVLLIYIFTFLSVIPVSAVGDGECTDCAVEYKSRIAELLFGKGSADKKKGKEITPSTVYLGGDVFGACVKQSFVTVTDSDGAGNFCVGDKILSANGVKISSAEALKSLIKTNGKAPIELVIKRKNEEKTISVVPKNIKGELTLGITLGDTAAGIGTLTYVQADGCFGGLGHGICDADTSEVIGIDGGDVTGVILGGVEKGAQGKPGELCGILTPTVKGEIFSNTECGVFGVLNNFTGEGMESIKVADRNEVHKGEAKIISTIKNGKKCEYSVEIFDIDRTSHGTKSFKIRVVDPVLIATTGGIVRGMSGSPIIQDGKLVGAVTHVMVADPTEGYGIFIENMLNAAQMPLAKAS